MKNPFEQAPKGYMIRATVIGGVLIAALLIASTICAGDSAGKSTSSAVRTISNFYLQELAGCREQVVSTNLDSCIANMRSAVSLMTEDDLSDTAHLQDFQAATRRDRSRRILRRGARA